MAMRVDPEALFSISPPAGAPAPSWQHPLDPVRAWDSLLEGRWIVTEHFGGECTHTILARPAATSSRGEALRADELYLAKRRAQGDSVKLLAIETARTSPFVSQRLASAIRKLKLKTEGDLVALLHDRSPSSLTASRIREGAGEFMILHYPAPSWPLPPCLTSAERSIVLSLIAGRSRDAIARARATSPRTVANQLASIFRRLGVQSRIGLLVALHRASRIGH